MVPSTNIMEAMVIVLYKTHVLQVSAGIAILPGSAWRVEEADGRPKCIEQQ